MRSDGWLFWLTEERDIGGRRRRLGCAPANETGSFLSVLLGEDVHLDVALLLL